MRTGTTEKMRKNCWEHFRAEIKILEPTLIFFHGDKPRESFLENLHREGVQSRPLLIGNTWEDLCRKVEWKGPNFPHPFESVLLFYHHPAYGHFFREWESRVVPVLNELRKERVLPILSNTWLSLTKTDWPTG